ncbi:MAG: aromatic ring-hydroxylating dioxygenase subunit alpha [Pseudomonadota bacterium]|nr:aromatic ring-hydroxylating dioxygenase subunit alpha [Pseudomonadota bacterium]
MFLHNRWYVAAQSQDLGKTPVAVHILNQPIVLFRITDGSIVALKDRCVHRQAPLSRGEVFGDIIQCAYHGFCFDRLGNCVRIPSQKKIPPGAHIQNYLVKEKHGHIFIWMGSQNLSKLEPIYEFPWKEDENWRVINIKFHAPFEYRLLIDNLMDLSHLAYLHQSTIGVDAVAAKATQKTERKDQRVIVTRLMENIDQAPTHIEITNFSGKVDRWQRVEFYPPGYFWVQTGSAITGKGANNADFKDILIKRNSVHMVVPETEATTNYFYTTVHKTENMTQKQESIFRKRMTQTFIEDIELLEQISARTDSKYPKIDVAADSGALEAQKVLNSLIGKQRIS